MQDNNKVEVFAKLLKSHDWYYAMSDDDRVYSIGLKQKNEIEAMRLEIDLSHNGLGTILFKEASPF